MERKVPYLPSTWTNNCTCKRGSSLGVRVRAVNCLSVFSFLFFMCHTERRACPAVCGANEPITDSLSENESEETHIHIKHQGKIRSLFRKTHISGFVNKKIGTIDYCTSKNIKSFTKKLWSTQLSFSVRRDNADFVNAMLKNKLWCIFFFFTRFWE